MCLQCHDRFAAAPERHTGHAAGSAAGRCVSCHMPRTADALLFKARSHQIDEIPDVAMTARFGLEDSPNACATCHADRGLELAGRRDGGPRPLTGVAAHTSDPELPAAADRPDSDSQLEC